MPPLRCRPAGSPPSTSARSGRPSRPDAAARTSAARSQDGGAEAQRSPVRRPCRCGNAMSELDEFRAEVAHLRDLVGAADLDTMQTRDMLKNQTRLLGALRENQNSMNRVLNEQGQALGGMVLAINGLQQRVSDVDKRVINVEHRVTSMDGRLTGVDIGRAHV